MRVYLLIHTPLMDPGDELRGIYLRREDAEADRETRDGPLGFVHGGCCRIEEREVHTEPVRAGEPRLV